jgi:glucose/arabinose dehydrogenase
MWIVVSCVTLMIACDRKSPPSPPAVDGSGGVETINGTEHVGWDQKAADTVELATIAYAIYVDGVRAELAGVTCATTATAAGFTCTARLPAMSVGSHTLELASFTNDGSILESARSAALRVMLTAQTATAERAVVPRAGPGLRVDRSVDDLQSPVDLEFAPDGRLFVAERAGRIRIVPPPSTSGGQAAPAAEPAISLASTLGPQGRLLAIALDPQFERTGFAFTIYAAPSRAGELEFTLARFHSVSDTLGDRAVLLDGVPASSNPSAALRFGPDGKLYAAFDDGGDERRRKDAASLNGKILRLNPDGTTPTDAVRGSPIYVDGLGAPFAIGWDPPTGTLWTADRTAGASPFAFYRGSLFPEWDGRLITAETLFDRRATQGVGVIAIGLDGAIYYAATAAIDRVVPYRAP